MENSLPFASYQLPKGKFSGLALCGEAPGAEEIKQGRPFCGRSGKLLDEVLGELSIVRENLLIVNVFRFQPPGNKVAHFFSSKRSGIKVSSLYGKYGSAYVQKQYEGELEALGNILKEYKPRAVVTLGRTPMWALTGYNGPMGAIRGVWQHCLLAEGIPVMPTYHPSFIIRGNWDQKAVLKGDIEKAMLKA